MVADIIPVTNTPPGLGVFSYIIPGELQNKIYPGQLVRIPFRNKLILGVVLKINASPSNSITLKEIDSALTTYPLVPLTILALTTELAIAHHSSLGTLLKSTLPALGPRALMKIKTLNLPRLQGITKSKSKPEYEFVTTPYEYIEKIISTSTLGLQQLILVPELQILEYLKTELSQKIALLAITSTTKPKDYATVWQTIRSSEPCVVLGTRRALFLPWTNLGHILVIEEGNRHYKSFDAAPRYQTEDLAVRLAELTDSQLTFLSHTPSAVRLKNYQREVPSLIGITFINMKEERASGNSSILSVELETQLKNIPGNALLLLNRLGGITALSCRDCDFVWRCPNCSRSLVLYQKSGELRCHYCSVKEKFTPVCPKCRGNNLKLFGTGTEALEKAILNRPWSNNYTVLRLDNATLLKKLPASNKPFLIVGTEFAFRYISPTNLSLCAVLDPDAALFVPEYNAVENMWQRLRALRFWLPQKTNLILQTRNVENVTLQGIAVPKLFYNQELSARKLFKYPPFYTILKIFKTGQNSVLAAEAAELYKTLNTLTKELKLAILEPPKPAFPAILGGFLRLIIIAKFEGNPSLETQIGIVKVLPRGWKIDWNPETLLTI